MDTGPGKFRRVLRIITRHSTLMISNDTQSQSEHSVSQFYWLFFLSFYEDVEIFFNLRYNVKIISAREV